MCSFSERGSALLNKQYRAVFDNAAIGIAIVKLDGTRLKANDKLCQITGKSRETLLQESIWEDTNLDDVSEGVEYFNRISRGDISSYEREKRILRANGEEIWVKVTASLCPAEENSDPTLVIFIEDIDKHKTAEIAQSLLGAEVIHRTKNLLTVILGVIRQLEKNSTSTQDLANAIRARILALSASYSIFSKTDWADPTLRQIIDEITHTLFPKYSDRIQVQMDHIEIGTQVAINLGLTIHELISNAIQHGALSSPEGHVDVSAFTSKSGDTLMLNILWQEKHGPQVSSPKTRGFGLFMLEKGVTGGMSGSCDLEFRSDGLRVSMSLPLPKVKGVLEHSRTHGR